MSPQLPIKKQSVIICCEGGIFMAGFGCRRPLHNRELADDFAQKVLGINKKLDKAATKIVNAELRWRSWRRRQQTPISNTAHDPIGMT